MTKNGDPLRSRRSQIERSRETLPPDRFGKLRFKGGGLVKFSNTSQLLGRAF
jgi:hypothetical protein